MALILDPDKLARAITRIGERPARPATSEAPAPATESAPDMLQEALELARLGLPVFPVHGVWQNTAGDLRCTCGNPQCGRNAGKHPATKNGLRDATRDEQRIGGWWSDRPRNNVGIATGVGVVLDVDPRNGGDHILTALEAQHGALPPTWVAKTGGGGWHVFFAQPPGGPPIGCSAGKIGAGLDVKGVGGYVVAAPSLHLSGQRYGWHTHPAKTPLAAMPSWLAERFHATKGPSAERPANHLAKLVTSAVGEGARNCTLASLVGHLMWSGKVSPHVALEFARLWNSAHCSPPLTDSEVVRIVDSISGRELRRRGVV